MTYQQWQTVENSLSNLNALDKLELVERLIHELRSSLAADHHTPTGLVKPLTESEFKQYLLKTGMMSSLPTSPDHPPRPEFEPASIVGEPISKMIIRERR